MNEQWLAAFILSTATLAGYQVGKPLLELLRERRKYSKGTRDADKLLWDRLKEAEGDVEKMQELIDELRGKLVKREDRIITLGLDLNTRKARLESAHKETSDVRVASAQLQTALKGRTNRIQELGREVADLRVANGNLEQAGASWYDQKLTGQKWPHYSPVRKGQEDQDWSAKDYEAIPKVDTARVYRHGITARPDSVELLRADGPYLTVKERAKHPDTGVPICRVFTVFDLNGGMHKNFKLEATRKQGHPMTPEA